MYNAQGLCLAQGSPWHSSVLSLALELDIKLHVRTYVRSLLTRIDIAKIYAVVVVLFLFNHPDIKHTIATSGVRKVRFKARFESKEPVTN